MISFKKLLVFATVGVFFMSGCSLQQMIKLAEDQNLTVEPSPLEVHGGTVDFSISATLPPKMLKKDKVYEISVFYEYSGEEYAFDPIVFDAADYPNAKTESVSASQEFSMPYTEGMDPGDLTMLGVAKDPAKGKEESMDGRLTIAQGLITTSTLVQPSSYVAYADHGYNNQEELIPTNVNFYFEQGRSTLRRSETRSDRGEALNAFIAEKNVTRSVTIVGHHSPEGEERVNSELAQDRAEVVKDYYIRQMKRYEYEEGAADSIEFITKPVVENWDAFKDSLDTFDGIEEDAKDKILSTIRNTGGFEAAHKEIADMDFYKTMLQDLYPQLRFAATEVLTVKEKKTDAEISTLAKGIVEGSESADTLSVEELLYSATLTPSLKEKVAIYKKAVELHDDWVSHNNLGAAMLESAMKMEGDAMTAMVKKAETHFETSLQKKDNPEAHLNVATIALHMGDVEKGMEHIDAASGMSMTSEHKEGMMGMKGMALITKGDYEGALKALSGSTDTAVNNFNTGLAQVLSKDYELATQTLAEQSNYEDEMALAYYVSAIANARLNKAEEMAADLTKATEMDADLKAKATSDLEFVNFRGTAAFEDALK